MSLEAPYLTPVEGLMDTFSQVRTRRYSTYDHEKHHHIPFGYISGRVAPPEAQQERSKLVREIWSRGWGSAQIFFPDDLMNQIGKPTHPSVVDIYFCGKSLATELTCQAILPISQIGSYTLPELALASLLGMPSDFSCPWYVSQHHIDSIRSDTTSMLDHIKSCNLLPRLTRPMRPDEEEALSQHTFWSALEFFLKGERGFLSLSYDIIKYRLRRFFPDREQFPILRTNVVDSHTDFRPFWATVEGEGFQLLNEFDQDRRGCWVMDPDTFAYRYLLRTYEGTLVPTPPRIYDALED